MTSNSAATRHHSPPPSSSFSLKRNKTIAVIVEVNQGKMVRLLAPHLRAALEALTGGVRARRCDRIEESGGQLRGVEANSALRRGLAVAEKSNGQVFDVSGPLRGQLEELDVVPLHAVYGHWRRQSRYSVTEKEKKL